MRSLWEVGRRTIALACTACGSAALTFFGSAPPCAADANQVLASLTARDQSPATRLALSALTRMFDARDCLTSFHVEYIDRSIPIADYHVTVVGDIERPNKFNLRLYQGAKFLMQVVSNGIVETFYEPHANVYVHTHTPANYSSKSELVPGPIPESGADLLVAEGLEGAKFLLGKTTTPDVTAIKSFLGDATLIVSAPDVSGTSCNYVDLHGPASIRVLRFAIDRRTNLPLEYDIVDAPYPYIHDGDVVRDFQFVTITPVAGRFPDKAFRWVVPAGATPYQAPAPPSKPNPNLVYPRYQPAPPATFQLIGGGDRRHG